MRLPSLALAVALGAVLAGCPSNNPPATDGGLDGGGGGAGGGAGGGGAGGGGGDAGVNPDRHCAPGNSQCAAGSECLGTALPDGGLGSDCHVGACDLLAQGCDAGFKCTYVLEDGGVGSPLVRGCSPEGSADDGQPCAPTTTSNTCKAGLICVPGADGGQCAKFCNSVADCGTAKLCDLIVTVTGSVERPTVCGDAPPGCDLLAQDCARATDGCYPQGNAGACFNAGAHNDGDGCQFSNDCKKGSTCVGTAGSTFCRAICAFPGGACASGSCVKLTTQSNVGVCQ